MTTFLQRDDFAVTARVLGALFYYSPESHETAPLVQALLNDDWQAQWPLDAEALAPVAAMFKTHSEESLPQAWQRLFIGPYALPSPPWGSVWLDRESVLFGDSTLALRQWMRENGIQFEMQQNEPEDHFGALLLLAAWVGLLSVAYLTGTWSSPKAGAMTSRYGRGPVMLFSTAVMLGGLLLTLFTSLWLIFAGMLLFSAGFFAAHSVASSWIGPRARRAKGQASSLYLFSYYLGSSIAGTLGGVFWHSYGWNGVGGFIALMLVLAILVGTRLHHRLHA
ncbi:TPA_asm: Tat proofreading chaperone DmsD [Salmonella enterica subsp. enterica serovar Typhi str. CT18]|uniref:Tat proofreading chaperone DmsD n=6 Tax=Salmonella enterica TaxID=28901 RepID=A0A716QZH1_SALTI|nr:Tat proofreading chaperone DmsD [Salmonella enterica subsp. enterica serovar Typhi str. CT18]